MLALLARRRVRRGAPGRRAGRWIRVLSVVPLGLAGWLLGVLFAWTLAPAWFVESPVVVVPGAGLLIGLGAHLARPAANPVSGRFTGPAATVAGALAGAVLATPAGSGPAVPALGILGAAGGANLVVALRSRPAPAGTDRRDGEPLIPECVTHCHNASWFRRCKTAESPCRHFFVRPVGG